MPRGRWDYSQTHVLYWLPDHNLSNCLSFILFPHCPVKFTNALKEAFLKCFLLRFLWSLACLLLLYPRSFQGLCDSSEMLLIFNIWCQWGWPKLEAPPCIDNGIATWSQSLCIIFFGGALRKVHISVGILEDFMNEKLLKTWHQFKHCFQFCYCVDSQMLRLTMDKMCELNFFLSADLDSLWGILKTAK